jgi:outer membrane cobalamin receptor
VHGTRIGVIQAGSRGSQTSIFPRGADDFSDLTTNNIEYIEVIHEPQSTRYGSDAIGAVTQYVRHMRNLHSLMKIDNLLDADYEQVLGFSQPGISVRGGAVGNF